MDFRARHMMVTYVRGHFKDIHGSLKFDPENPRNSSVEVRNIAGDVDRYWKTLDSSGTIRLFMFDQIQRRTRT
jgi:polyisoprenoid-binding protein YceI